MKTFALCIGMLMSLSLSAQLEVQSVETTSHTVGKCNNGMYYSGLLTYKVIEDDTMYTLSYRDFQYTTSVPFYDEISFNGNNKTLNDLYKIFKSVFKEENKKNKNYAVNLKLGNNQVTIGTYRFMGITMSQITTSLGWGYFSEEQLDKLFGKAY